MNSKDTKYYSFFQNTKCEYFPCHKIENVEEFNCLFCYCPLYALGEKCRGNFTYTEKGIKNCVACNIPHRAKNYEYILSRFPEIAELAKKKDALDENDIGSRCIYCTPKSELKD
ncbi:MAG: cysteine-rich small domain-containing protein [Eubacterium sp.]|nr:cysteine-rich small domain-containing protein [Eubacterium sp.]